MRDVQIRLGPAADDHLVLIEDERLLGRVEQRHRDDEREDLVGAALAHHSSPRNALTMTPPNITSMQAARIKMSGSLTSTPARPAICSAR
jgi:hypothetical protein